MAIVNEVSAIISGRILSMFCRSGRSWLVIRGLEKAPTDGNTPFVEVESGVFCMRERRQDSAKREFRLSSIHTARAMVGSGRLVRSKSVCTSFAEGSSREAAMGIIFVR